MVLGRQLRHKREWESSPVSAFQTSAGIPPANVPVLDGRTLKSHGKEQGEDVGPLMQSDGRARRERLRRRRR